MSTEKMTVDAASEITELARNIDGYAGRRGFSLKKLVSENPSLGSEKTFRDMRDGTTEGYDLDKQLPNYRACWDMIQEMSGSDTGEQLFDDLPGVTQIRLAVLEVMKSWGNDRVIIVDGDMGTGKSTAARFLRGRYGSRIVLVECTEMWNDSPRAMLADMIEALGTKSADGLSGMQLLKKSLEILCSVRRCIILDEAHHMGPRCMNVIKTLVNRTPGEFVLMGIPSLLAKMERNAYIEAKQLSTNRLSERVKFAFNERAIQTYLANIFPDASKEELALASKMIYPSATNNGCYSFVRDVARKIRSSGLTSAAVKEAIEKINDKRKK